VDFSQLLIVLSQNGWGVVLVLVLIWIVVKGEFVLRYPARDLDRQKKDS